MNSTRRRSVVVLAVVLTFGVLFIGLTRRPPAPPTAGRPAGAPPSTGPTPVETGTGADSDAGSAEERSQSWAARSEDGAAAAAAGYLAELARLSLAGPAGREAALRRIVAPNSGPLVAQTLAAMAVVDKTLGDARRVLPGARALMREVPVAYVVHSFSPERAQVGIWGLSVVLIEGRTQATEVWSTNTVDLSWQAGGWRAAGWSRTPGPTPAAGLDRASDPAVVLAAIEGWEGFGYAPRS